MNATAEQLARFAAMVGITPETHRQCFRSWWKCTECQRTDEWLHPAGGEPHKGYGYWHYHMNTEGVACGPLFTDHQPIYLPALDTPAGDDVFLAPFMRWLGNRKGDWFIEDWVSNLSTVALLDLCQSAGVAEVVEIFGRAE